jgi:4-amino-4-deoxy-L-arabinose transferase-like glycosyltransferase
LRFFAGPSSPNTSTPSRLLRDASLVVAAALTVLLLNLGAPPLFDDDEPRNAGCSLAMLDRGDWVVPTFHGELRVHKPPLVNWVQMAGLSLAGRNEVGARIGSVFLTVASCLMTWRIGCLLFSPAVGLTTGLAMAGCIWTAIGGRAATPDAPLVFATTCTLWLLAGGLDAAGQLRLSLGRAALVGASAGVAMLAKGPVGLVVPAGAAGLFCLWQSRDLAPGSLTAWGANATVAVRQLRPLLVTATAAVTALPWYIWVGLRTDWEWPRRFFLEHNLDRFTAPLEGHSGSIAYYPLVLVIGLFPWSIASLIAVGHTVGRFWSEQDRSQLAARRLLAAWVVAWVGFFTIAGTKLPGYVWPAYPALAVLVAAFWQAWSQAPSRADRWMPIAWCSLVLSGVAFACVGPLATSRGLPTSFASAGGWFLAAGVVAAVGGVAGWLLQNDGVPGHRRLIPTMLAAVGVGTTALLAAAAAEAFAPLGPRAIVAEIPLGAEVGVNSWGSPSGVFYATARHGADRVVRLEEPEDILSHLEAKPEAFLLVDPRFADRVLAQLPRSHRVLGTTASVPGGKQLMLIGPHHDARQTIDRLSSRTHAAPAHPL